MTGPRPSEARRARAAERARHARARRAAGKIAITIEVEHFPVADALIEDRRLGEWADSDRSALRTALERLVSDWARGSITRYGVDVSAKSKLWTNQLDDAREANRADEEHNNG
jgi:DNA-binding FadR family transcriptional regulator